MCDGQGKSVRIATVGSGKSDAWWEEAYSYGVGENAWYFGVDGIDEKSEWYRIGSKFEDQWKRMKEGRDKGHCIVWQYIVFGYNEHEIDEAIEIAKKEDFALLLVNTNRGFRPDNPLLRDNVDFKLKSPSRAMTQLRVKKEWFAHRTEALANWHRLPRKKWMDEELQRFENKSR